MKKRMQTIGASLALALAAATGMAVPVGASPSNGTCQNVAISVALGAGQPANKTAQGTLCTPNTWAEGAHQIDVLVHGATYNRQYWDWPVNPATYSYVDDTLGAGRATFAYDRLGTGQTTTPPSALVTMAADAHVMHQVVQYLRATPYSYTEVNAIGHSFGSMVSIHEAATYHDVDRLVVTGALHTLGPVYATNGISFYPAMLDAQFAGLLDPGYLTTLPGTRGGVFYNATADPAVIAYDEAHKEKTSATQFADGMAALQTPALLNISQGITAPVITVVGEQDTLFCGLLLTCTQPNVAAFEAPFYTNAASFDAAVTADTAHNLALHPSAPTTFATINQWILTH